VTYLGSDYTITGLSSFAGPDQLIFYPAAEPVDRSGVAFAVGPTYSFSVYEDNGGYDPGSPYYCAGGNICVIFGATDGSSMDTPIALTGGSVTITAAPEASTWVMMAAGFAGLGWLGLARRRTVRSAAV
jgi:hypothetical protein